MRRLFALVAAVILVDTMFYAAIVPLLPTYADDLGLSKTATGILSASYAAGTLIACIPAGFFAARVGVRPAMLLGLALLALSSAAFAFADSIVVLDVARFAQGLGGACAWTGGLTWIMTASPRERRGEMIGSVLAVAIFGIMLGPVLGGVASELGPEGVFGAVAVIAACLFVWAATAEGVEPDPPLPVRTVVSLVSTPRILAAIWLVTLPSILAGLFDVLVPLRLDDLGAGAIGIGAVFLIAAAVEAVVSPMIGSLSDRRGRLVLIRAGLWASAITGAILWLPGTVVLLGVATTAVILCLSLLWTPAMALLSDRAEAGGLDLAFAAALVNLAWSGGQVVGGSLGAGFAEVTSDAAAYLLVASLFAVTALRFLIVRRPVLA